MRPLGDKVVVRKFKEGEKVLESGIVLPETIQEKEQGTAQGEVIAVGPGRHRDGLGFHQGALTNVSDLIPMTVQVGDRVLFARYSGNITKIEGVEHVILGEREILAILD